MIEIFSETINVEREAPRYALSPSLLHELRTPLNQIIGYSELLLEQAQEEGQSALLPDISKVRSAGGELLTLIDNNFISLQTQELPAATNGQNSLRDVSRAIPSTTLPAVEAEQGRVLVVDDSASNRDILTRRLKQQGYAVTTAENGRKALDLISGAGFDLVLLDITMPEMDGFEVLRHLKADPLLKHIPVIVISAVNDTESVVRCIEMGAEDYLPKPSDSTLLKARTVACMERKRAHDRELRYTQELQVSYQRGQELEQMRDDLTNMIVHDLRSPLTSIISGLQTLDTAGELNDTQHELLTVSLSGGSTLLGMIDDLLDINKMEGSSLRLDREQVAIEEIVASACMQIRSLATSKAVSLTTQIDPHLPLVSADRDKLLRTLVNLLSNAIKFTPERGCIKIGASKTEDGRSLLCSVSDTGEGIPPEALERIFEKFAQVETRTAGRFHATGLGLTFCKMIVDAHGGRIWVESEVGHGSTFSFSLAL